MRQYQAADGTWKVAPQEWHHFSHEPALRTLIWMQCHIRTEEQGRLLNVCVELARRLNPDTQLLLMNNASPLDPRAFLEFEYRCNHTMDNLTAMFTEPLQIVHFPDAIGHFSPKFTHEMPREQMRDGPGRANMTALRIAADSGYDRAMYLESDAPYVKPASWGFDQMTRPVGCAPRIKWGYLEWTPWWIKDIPWFVNDFNFPARYNWEGQTPDKPEGERQYETIMGEYLQVLPVKGARGDYWEKPDGTIHPGWITPQNIRGIFPDGCDSITHVSMDTHREFLKMNGYDDLVERL